MDAAVATVDDPRSTAPSPTAARRTAPSSAKPHGATLAVLIVGAVLTVVLVVLAQSIHDRNEDRLLRQRVREAGAVLTAAVPGIQIPLSSAVEVTDLTASTDFDAFERLMSPLVESGRPYVSASIWSLGDGTAVPDLVIGEPPKLAELPSDDVQAFFDRALVAGELAVLGLVDGPSPRLGYAVASVDGAVPFVAYAEAALPAERTSVVPTGSAFEGLDNAVYLGSSEADDALLTASRADLPLTGRRATEVVDFGDTTLLLVMSPASDLGGRPMALLPWLLALVGGAVTVAAAASTELLLRRRDSATRLADENERLYREQRTVARTLQLSLLPDRLPEVPGMEFASRYLAGADGVDVGGDWYDVIVLDDGAVLLVVGDVSGRGLRAATLMASLRSWVRAFASEGHQPAAILSQLCRLLDVHTDGHFATVLCVLADLRARTLTIANAGHPNPLMQLGGTVASIDAPIGLPVGVNASATYESAVVRLPNDQEATLLAYTDGLYERRGESIDRGLERLQATAGIQFASLQDWVSHIVESLLVDAAHDDTAILGVRWNRPN